MTDPVISPDGKWMWTGSEWIPAPPDTDPDTFSPKEKPSSDDFTNTNEKSENLVKQLMYVDKPLTYSEFEKEVLVVKNAVPNANEEEIIEAFIRSRDEFNVQPKKAVIGIIELFQRQTKSGVKIEITPSTKSLSHSSSDSRFKENSGTSDTNLNTSEKTTILCDKCHCMKLGKLRVCRGCGNAKVCKKCTWKKRLPWFIPLLILWPIIWAIFFIHEMCESCALDKKETDRSAWWPYLTKTIPLFVLFMTWAYFKSLQATV